MTLFGWVRTPLVTDARGTMVASAVVVLTLGMSLVGMF